MAGFAGGSADRARRGAGTRFAAAGGPAVGTIDDRRLAPRTTAQLQPSLGAGSPATIVDLDHPGACTLGRAAQRALVNLLAGSSRTPERAVPPGGFRA